MSIAMPLPSEWTVRSTVGAGVRLGLEYLTAFTVTGLVFTAPAFILEMREVSGFPKFAADLLGYVAAQICILCSTFEALAGRTPNVGGTLRQVQRQDLIRLMIFACVQALVFLLGTLLFAIPGFVLMTLYAVALPAMVLTEDLPIGDALRQSVALTSGRRWRVFGVVLACLGTAVGVIVLVSLVLQIVPISIERGELRTMVLWPLTALVGAFLHPVAAVLYVLLRQEKEGLTVEEIVEPFY